MQSRYLSVRPLYHRMSTFLEEESDAEKEIKYRKLGLTDPKMFSQLLNIEGYEELLLDGMVEVLENNLRSATDKLAPLKVGK